MKQRFALWSLIIFSFLNTAAANPPPASADKADFTGYDVVILEKTGEFDHVFTTQMSRESYSYKLKFLTQKGITDHGYRTITYDPAREHISDIKGSVILPDGKTIEITKSNIFKKKLVRTLRSKKSEIRVVFPSLEPGAVVNYSYRRSYNGMRWISTWNFQGEYYTVRSSITFIPWPAYRWAYSMRNIQVEPQCAKSHRGSDKTFTYVMENVPPLPREPDSLAYASQRKSITFYYMRYHYDNFWTDGVTHYYKKYLKQLMKPCAASKKLANQHFLSIQDNAKRIQAIYDYALDHYISVDMLSKAEQKEVNETHWRHLLKADSASDLFKNKYVTSWQTTYILASLLKAALPKTAEIELVMYVPWDENTLDANCLSMRQLTKRVLKVTCDGKTWWLDPAARYRPANQLDWSAKGIYVLITNKNSTHSKKIPLDKPSDNESALKITVTFDTENGTATIRENTTYNKYDSYDMRAALMFLTEREQRDFLENNLKERYGDETELTSFTLTHLEDIHFPLVSDLEYRIPYEFDEAGDQILMDFPGRDMPENNPFLADKRIGHIYFPYAYHQVQDITYIIPPEYQIVRVPDAVRINRNLYIYNIDYEKTGPNELRVKIDETLQGNMIKKDAADFLKRTYNNILEAGRVKLVLRETPSE